jgi:hypothetical protein
LFGIQAGIFQRDSGLTRKDLKEFEVCFARVGLSFHLITRAREHAITQKRNAGFVVYNKDDGSLHV